MKSQISRSGDRSSRRYSGVFQQQGRMLTDADWNELMEIVGRRIEESIGDTIGRGVPKVGGAGVEMAAGALMLRPGIVHAGGLRGELRAKPSAGLAPDALLVLDQQADLPDGPSEIPANTAATLYADVWDRPLTAFEDSHLLDPGLHGADTTTRTQRMCQIKWCPATIDPENPVQNPPRGAALLTLKLRSATTANDPCDPCKEIFDVESRAGNYLFRLEVHDVKGPVTDPTEIVLKWSSENGAELAYGKEYPLGWADTGWIFEKLEVAEIQWPDGGKGVIASADRHLGANWAENYPNPERGKLLDKLPAPDANSKNWIRRWDGTLTLRKDGAGNWALADVTADVFHLDRGVAMTTKDAVLVPGTVAIDGTKVTAELSNLTLTLDLQRKICLPGDYWLAEVREEVHTPGKSVLENAGPEGVVHHYVTLRSILADGSLEPLPTRKNIALHHPSLTTIDAVDVTYGPHCDNGFFDAGLHDTVQKALDHVCELRAEHIAYKPKSSCDLGVDDTTVREALDALCDRTIQKGGCCKAIGLRELGGEFLTLEAALIDVLANNRRNASFCLLEGEHVIPENLVLPPLDSFHLSGPGPSAVLSLGDAVLRFSETAQVSFNGVNLQANGPAAVFSDCESVVIEHSHFVQRDPRGALLVIQGEKQLVIRDSQLDAASLAGILVNVPGWIKNVDELKKLFDPALDAAEFERRAVERMRQIRELPREKREPIAKLIQDQLPHGDEEFGEREKVLMRGFVQEVRKPAIVLGSLMKILLTLRSLYLRGATPGVALLLRPGDGRALVEGNSIAGRIILRHREGEEIDQAEWPDASTIKNVSKRFTNKDLAPSLESHKAELIVTDNTFSRITVDKKTFEWIVGPSAGNLPAGYRRLILDRNTITEEKSIVTGRSVDCSRSWFMAGDESGRFMILAVARDAVMIGNRSHTENAPTAARIARLGDAAFNDMTFVP